jgi:hypothetical protein
MVALIDEMLAKIQGLPPAAYNELVKEYNKNRPTWFPTPGPQQEAYYCPAFEMLYGGQGGGGKTDLALGLAFTAHQRSLIMRRQYTDLTGITERAIEINGTRDGYSGAIPPKLRTADNRLIQFGAHKDAGDETTWQGNRFDLKVFDEACQHLESQVRFHLGWVGSANPKQRSRALLVSNPPIDASGDWMIKRYRPWLDLTHHNPAKYGELRWFLTTPEGEDLEVEDGTPREFIVEGKPKIYIPTTRTFIPATLGDNPFLIDSGYQATLDALPEPLRTAVRDGNFMASRVDAPFQVIPTAWIQAAQARWTKDGKRGKKMTAMAYDPAGGGRDTAELIARYEGWYDEPVSEKGIHTADGSESVALIFKHRRDGAAIILDVGGGYAGQTKQRLDDNETPFFAFNGNSAGIGRDKSGKLKFYNARARAWWKLREDLDPDQDGGSIIALPPNTEMANDLAAPTYSVTKQGILIESKDDIRKRLGRSPGKGDAVVMAWDDGAMVQRRRAADGGRALPQSAKSTRKGPLQRRRG